MTPQELEEYNKALKQGGVDHSTPKAAFKIPDAGACLVRFVQYIELGLQKSKNPTYNDSRECALGFEVVSKRHNIVNDGKIIHPIIQASVNISQSTKGNFIPLVKALNYAGIEHAVITEFLGGAYKAKITHEKSPDGSKTYARLKAKGEPWNFSAPIQEDPEDPSNSVMLNVAPHKSDIICFCWEPSMVSDEHYLASWDSLYIEGTYQDGGSRNKWQEKIMANLNWSTSRLKRLLDARNSTGGKEIEVNDGGLDEAWDESEEI